MARFDYEATEAEDLGFVAGDIIQLVEHVGDEWLRGELDGKTGVFPVAFVEIVEHLPSRATGKMLIVLSTFFNCSYLSTFLHIHFIFCTLNCDR